MVLATFPVKSVKLLPGWKMLLSSVPNLTGKYDTMEKSLHRDPR